MTNPNGLAIVVVVLFNFFYYIICVCDVCGHTHAMAHVEGGFRTQLFLPCEC